MSLTPAVANYAGSPLFSGTKETATLTVLPAEALAIVTTTLISTTEVSKEVSTFTAQLTWLQTDWPYLIVVLAVVAVAVVVLTRKSMRKSEER